MPTRRLDDRIRQLCARATSAAQNEDVTQAEIENILQDLLAAVQEKVARLRQLATQKLLNTGNHAEDRPDRRVTPS
jgi:hypothetical protein